MTIGDRADIIFEASWNAQEAINQELDEMEQRLTEDDNTLSNRISAVEDTIVKYRELSNNNAENPLILKDNTEYSATEPINNLTIEYPNNNFICSLYFTTVSEGSITITFPDTTKYIGGAPDFKLGETWELNIKNGVVVAGKVEEA